MIHGDKPSGYFVTTDKNGRKIEGETRQCVHCQFMWNYVPGSKQRRGYCIKCKGLICARLECLTEQEKLTVGTHRTCIPFEERNERLLDAADKLVNKGLVLGQDFITTDSGILIKK